MRRPDPAKLKNGGWIETMQDFSMKSIRSLIAMEGQLIFSTRPIP